MKKNKILTVLIIFTLLILFGCDVGMNYEFIVINETSEEIKVEFKQYDHQEVQKSVIVNPDEKKTLAIGSGPRCGGVYCDAYRLTKYESEDSTFRYPVAEIKIFIRDTSESKIDYNNEYNWEFESKRKLGIYIARISDTVF